MSNSQIEENYYQTLSIITNLYDKLASHSKIEFTSNESNKTPAFKTKFHHEETINSISDKMKNAILKTRDKVYTERKESSQELHLFAQLQREELKAMQIKKESLKELLQLAKYCKDSDVINLNISGTHCISTFRGTLRKYPNSLLGLLFSGNVTIIKDKWDYYFIDRDGAAFTTMISYLRTGNIPMFNNYIEECTFKQELAYWNIPLINNSRSSL